MAILVAPPFHERAQARFFPVDGMRVDSLMLVAAVILIVFLHMVATTRLSHIGHILRYPPLPVSAAIGILIFAGFQILLANRGRESMDWRAVAAVEGLYIAVWVGYALISWAAQKSLRRLTTSNVSDQSTEAAQSELDDARLSAWLERESPINEPTADMFQHTIIAERVVRRLAKGENTIALLGPFGSGKSSIGRIAERLAKTQRIPLIFAEVSCWGFGESLDAQEELLSQVIRRVSQHVETLGLRSLPAEYVNAVGSRAGWYEALLRLLSGRRNPQRVLLRMSPILSAIRKNVVLFIEDADRNFPTFDMSQLEALLMRLREIHGLSFVLCISPTQKIDLARLCERTEFVPPLDQRAALRLIQQTRDLLLRQFPVGVMLDAPEALVAKDEDYKVLEWHLGYFWPRQLILPMLANTPRTLKRALRRVVDAWPTLCGEVNIDDLINISVLREGAPEAFAFFQANHRFFGPAVKETRDLMEAAKTKLKESLVDEWQQISATRSFDARSAAWLMKQIHPASAGITGLMSSYTVRRQSMQSERRGDIYARRLLTESTAGDEISDQRMFRLLKSAQSADAKLAELAEVITDSKFASDAFEEFANALGFDRMLPLLSHVYRIIRARDGARLSRDDHPGFFAPWRMAVDNRPAGFDDWLANELQLCVPNHLRLLTEIYYFWLGTDRHTAAERNCSRHAINSALRQAWTTMPPAEIARGFDPSFPYTLFHLFFTSDYEKPEAVPLSKIEDWAWSRLPLTAAAQAAPSTMLPQVITALNSTSSRGREVPRFTLDETLLRSWFGSHAATIVGLIANGFALPQELGARERYVINQATEQIKVQSSDESNGTEDATEGEIRLSGKEMRSRLDI